VVVDMASDDATVAVAQRFGARIFSHPRVGFADPAREFGCAHAVGDWILVLDADEMVPEPLSRRLREIALTDAADVVRLPRLNYILGGPLPHTGWNPDRDRQTRFFKRGSVRMSALIHQHPVLQGAARLLELSAGSDSDHALVHFNYLDTTHFLYKLNSYTSIEAEQARAAGARSRSAWGLRRAARETLARFFWHGGWRDGWRGFCLSAFMSAYSLAVEAKLQELEDPGGRGEAIRRYRDAAETLLSEYPASAAAPSA
jgi:glycosyltransferase involved in cell wall biosynthesis